MNATRSQSATAMIMTPGHPFLPGIIKWWRGWNANSVNVRPGGEANIKELALACERAGTKVAVNSDGHSIYHLGRVEHILNLLREIDFPQELVVNASMETLVQVLHAT